MQNNQTIVFSKNVKEDLKVILEKAKSEGFSIGYYKEKYTIMDISLKKDEIISSIPKWKKIKLLKDTLKVVNHTSSLPISIAERLIGNGFSYSYSSSNVEILHVIYSLDFEGDFEAISYTLNNSKQALPISRNTHMLNIFFYSQKPVQEISESLKHQRNQIVALIENNQRDIDDFFKSQRDEISKAIDEGIKLGEEKRKVNDDNNNLLI